MRGYIGVTRSSGTIRGGEVSRVQDSVLCGVHSMGHGLQGAENMIGLPSRWAIIARNGGWRRAKLVDGKDKDEMSEKRIRERIDCLKDHVTADQSE